MFQEQVEQAARRLMGESRRIVGARNPVLDGIRAATAAFEQSRFHDSRREWHWLLVQMSLVARPKPGHEEEYWDFVISLRQALGEVVIHGRQHFRPPTDGPMTPEQFQWIEGLVADTRSILLLPRPGQLRSALRDYSLALMDVWRGHVGCAEELKSPLFRARVFDRTSRWTQFSEFGPPPGGTRAYGRAHRVGHSIFYAACDEKTAIAEVRPDVGAAVVVGKWLPRPEQFLAVRAFCPDEAILPKEFLYTPSADDNPRDLGAEAAFKVRALFAEAFQRPVSEGDDPVDYCVSAVLGDYALRDFDAVYYPSARHRDGWNLALRTEIAQERYELGSAREYAVVKRGSRDASVDVELVAEGSAVEGTIHWRDFNDGN